LKYKFEQSKLIILTIDGLRTDMVEGFDELSYEFDYNQLKLKSFQTSIERYPN